jgi:hypothetical protein
VRHFTVRSFAAAAAVLSLTGLIGFQALLPSLAAAKSKDENCEPADNGRAGPGHFRFVTSACENEGTTLATLPLHRGTSKGQTVWYVVMDSSDENDARTRGVNFVPKLVNAKGTPAVQNATIRNGVVDFPGTVDFGHKRVLVPSATGFPPAQASPPAFGDSKYSPLVQLPNGIVINAPQVANNTGQADKVVRINRAGDGEGNEDGESKGRSHSQTASVVYRETEGFYEDKHVHYASFDSSSSVAAAIEDVTYAPNLGTAPAPGDEAPATSAREALAAFTNGPTGRNNPERQGLNSALLDGLDPFNILHESPILPQHSDVGSLEYSPLWDAHFAEWTQEAINAGARVQLRSYDEVLDRVAQGNVTGFRGSPFGPSGPVVNCPLISIDIP